MRENRNQNSLIHVAARFLNLLDEPQANHKEALEKNTKRYVASNASMDMALQVVYMYLRRTILNLELDYTPPAVPRFKPTALNKELIGFPNWAVILNAVDVWVPIGVRICSDLPPLCTLDSGDDYYHTCYHQKCDVTSQAVFGIVQTVLYYLPQDKVRAVTKWIEDGAFIVKADGTTLPAEGNKVVIRRAIRRYINQVRVK